jgi:undecaprenyl-diphosphatase
MPRPARALPLHHAVILGLLHGPTELLPISSSAHTTLVPWLAGWPYGDLNPRLRKSFEVALHSGTAVALVLKRPTAPLHGRASFLAAALGPPALAGYVLGEQIERRLGEPATIAAGLLGGSLAMLVAEMHSKKCRPPRARGTRLFGKTQTAGSQPAASAGVRDGLALGLAQTLALIPGVSRNGATLAAARTGGFSRVDADQLSWSVGLPVIAGASLLQGTRLAREQARAGASSTAYGASLSLAVGAASAFLSTLICAKALDQRQRARLFPACVAYRGALAMFVIRRMRDNTSRTTQDPKK